MVMVWYAMGGRYLVRVKLAGCASVNKLAELANNNCTAFIILTALVLVGCWCLKRLAIGDLLCGWMLDSFDKSLTNYLFNVFRIGTMYATVLSRLSKRCSVLP